MEKEIIGHGTWLDKLALKILEREKTLGRKPKVIKTESGLGASGFPHIGSLADAIRAYGISLAVVEMGYKSELIAYSDDKDGLRKVPAGLPKSLEKYLGFPVTSIPDPFNCHESYGEHMSSLLRDALDRSGVEYKFASATKVYAEGTLTKQIERILANAKRVGEIIREETEQKKYVEVLPYLPVCSKCGRIYTTKAYEFLPKEKKVLYVCEGMEIKGHKLKGCKHRGEADYSKGEGKLSWKGEFAARWATFQINFEAYGKDIADSVRVNDRICEEILEYPPPHHVRYEMFLDKSGKKISKSLGNVFTPQVWFRYGSPQSMLLLMFKRIIGTRTISVTDIPSYMSEIDELENIYFGKKSIPNKLERAKLRGLYAYCWLLKPPPQPSIHVPYNLLVYLARVAPKKTETEYIADKLKQYGYEKALGSDELKKRLEYAYNWAEDFAEIREKRVKVSKDEGEALEELIQLLKVTKDADTIQSSIFNLARKHSIETKDFFKLLYMILIGAPEGPRLGPYIIAMGRKNVAEALERALVP